MKIESYQDVLAALRTSAAGGELDGPKARKRERIVAAAAELFERHGYRLASISEVARRAGIAKGTVYLYFPSKGDLLLAVMMRESTSLYERMEPILGPEQDPKERLRRLLQQAALLQDAMPVFKRIKRGDPDLIAALDELDQAVLMPMMMLFGGIMGWLIREAAGGELGDDELRERTHVLIALFQSMPTITDTRLRGPVPLEVFSSNLADVLIDGITAPPRETP